MSSAGNTVLQAGQPVAGAGVLPSPPRKQYWEDFFVYEQDFLAIAAAATQIQNIQIQADSDFKLVKMAYSADLAGAAITESTAPIPLCTLQILDGGSGRNLFSNPIPIRNLFGTGELPFILPIPRIFRGKTTINLTLANFSAGTTYASVRLSLIGTKIFQGGPPM